MKAVKILAVAVAAGTSLVASGAWSQGVSSPQQASQRAAPASDAEFVRKATIGNRFELEMSQLALANAGDIRVKDMARMLIMDHTAMLKELEIASRDAATTVPPDLRLDADKQAKLDALKAKPKKSAEFDALYTADMRKAHDDSLALLKSYQQSGKSEKVKAWASKVLPIVQKHRDMLYAI